ncbi:MAG: tetratricopeptide repeat protein [Chloroflexota bacterium]|nr:tetratricopeptide repeat protein [Chloroflexota bacterium]
MNPSNHTITQPKDKTRGLRSFSLASVALALLWLFHAVSAVAWLRLDNRFPIGETALHLTRAFRVADAVAHPSLDLVSRLAQAADGQPPFYYLVTSPLIWLFGPGADGATLINLAFLALLLAGTFGIALRLLGLIGSPTGDDPAREISGLLTATLLSLFPLVFTYTRVYNPALALAAMVVLSIWFLLLTDRFRRRRYAVAFGLSVAAGMLTANLFWVFLIGPTTIVIIQTLRQPAAETSQRRRSRNAIQRSIHRLPLKASQWNGLFALLLSLLFVPYYLTAGVPLLPQQGSGFLSTLSHLDDAMGGFFLLLLILGLVYALWQAIRPAHAGIRLAFALPLSWFLLGYLIPAAAANEAAQGPDAGQILALLPAAAFLSVVWWRDLPRVLRKPQAMARRWSRVATGIAIVMLAVGTINFAIISWGVSSQAASLLGPTAAASGSALPLSDDAPLISPGRALVQQHPPQRVKWLVATTGDYIDRQCPRGSSCSVMVLPCLNSFSDETFAFYATREGLEDRITFQSLGADDDYYYQLLNSDYIIGKTGDMGCQVDTGIDDPNRKAAADNFNTLIETIDSSQAFDDRFQIKRRFEPLPDGSTVWIMQQVARPFELMDLDQQLLLLDHILQITPQSELARAQWLQTIAQLPDDVQAVERWQHTLDRLPDFLAGHVALADLYLEQHRYQDAIDQYQLAIDLSDERDPVRHRSLLGQAAAFDGLQQPLDALAAYEEANRVLRDDYDTLIEQGRFLIDQQRISQAIDTLTRARRLEPGRLEAHLELARADLVQEKVDAAEEHLQQARKIDPRSPEPLRVQAAALQGFGDPDGALALYQQAIELAPEEVPAYADSINHLLTLNRPEETLELAQRLVETLPNAAEALLVAAHAFDSLGMADDAIDLFQAVIELLPDNAAARLSLVQTLIKIGRYEQAREVIDAGVALGIGRSEMLGATADLMVAAGDRDAAIETYLAALTANPAYWPAAHNLGRLYMKKEQPALALKIAIEMANLRPDVYQIRVLAGDAYRTLGQLAEALQSFRAAEALAPEVSLVHGLIGQTLYDLGDNQRAEPSLLTAARLDLDNLDAQLTLGQVTLNLAVQESGGEVSTDDSRFAQAEQAFNAVLAGDPENLTTLIGLGDLNVAFAQLGEAARYYQEALLLAPGLKDVQQALIDSYLSLGNTESLIVFAESLLSDHPDDVVVLTFLGEALIAAGQPNTAVDAFDLFLSRHPDNLDAMLAEAHTLANSGLTEQALAAFDRITRRRPALALAHVGRGDTLATLNRLADAETAYRLAIEKIADATVEKETLASANLGLARVLLNQGHIEDAHRIARELVDGQTARPETRVLLGDTFQALGQPLDALAEYERALDLAYNDGPANRQMAHRMLETGDLADARLAYEKALEANPSDVASLIGLAKVLNRESGTAVSLAQDERIELQRAKQLLERALALAPGNLHAQRELGDTLLALGDAGRAIELFQALLLNQPTHPSAGHSLRHALAAAQDAEAILTGYEELIAGAGDGKVGEEAGFALAMAYRSLDRQDDARETLTTLLETNPDESKLHLALAELLLADHQLQEAQSHLQRAVDIDPADARAVQRLGRFHLDTGQLEKASALADNLMENQPESAYGFLLAGQSAQANQDEAEALLAFRRAGGLAPDDSFMQTQVGEGYLRADRQENARTSYQSGVAADRRNPDALIGLARIESAQGHPGIALDLLQQALTLDPGYRASQAALGGFLLDSGRADEAIPYLKSALEKELEAYTTGELRALARTSAVPRGLARAYLATGHRDEGLALLQKTLDPEREQLPLIVAESLLAVGQIEQAIDAYQELVAAQPDDAGPLIELAQAYSQIADFDSALDAYQQASAIDPDDFRTYLRQGAVLMALDRSAEAIPIFENAVALLELIPDVVGRTGPGSDGESGDLQLWQAWTELARAYSETGRPQKALETNLAIAEIRPDLYEIQVLIGDNYRDLAEPGQALAAYDEAIRLSSGAAMPYSRQGYIYLAQPGQSQAAETAFMTALDLDAAHAAALEGLARLYAQTGPDGSNLDFLKAEARFRQAIELESENPDIRIGLADLYASFDRHSEAAALYRSALEIAPRLSEVRQKLAESLLSSGMVEEAKQELLQLASELPDKPGAWINLAQIYRSQGDFERAEEAYLEVMTRKPGDHKLKIALGDLYLTKGEISRAEALYREVIEGIEPDDRSDEAMSVLGQAQNQLGKALLRLGQTDDAVTVAETLIDQQPASYRGYGLLSDIYGGQNNLVDAMEILESGLSIVNDRIPLGLRLGNYLLRLDRPEDAQELFEQLIDESPQVVDAHIGLAQSHMAQASELRTLRFDFADTALRNALLLDPDSVAAHTAMGDLMMLYEHPKRAADAYKTALDMRTSTAGDSALRLKLAEAYAASDQWQAALQEYQRVAIANPEEVGLQMTLGNAFTASGRIDQALEQFRLVNRIAPDFPFAYIKQAEVLDSLGESAQALAAYQAAVAAAPDSADAYFTLATAYRARDMIDEAIASLERGLAIDPDREAPRQVLEVLKAER